MKLVLMALIFLSVGCQSTKDFLGLETRSSEDAKKRSAAPTLMPDGSPIVKFSENPMVLNPSDRQYKRMTRAKMEEESDVHAQAGSMWVMEGQGSYLFAQNRTRREGDTLNIQLEGATLKQVESKVNVIKKLQAAVEEEKKRQKLEAEKALRAPASEEGGAVATTTPEPAKPEATPAKPEEPLVVELIPTRITEKLADGSFRVKGTQEIMIGNKEYKVLLAGVVRPEDFNETTTGSNRIIDSQVDVVSMNWSSDE